MGRDLASRLGVLGAVLACGACLAPVLAAGLGAIGLAAWTGWIGVAALPLLAVGLALVGYRAWVARRRSS